MADSDREEEIRRRAQEGGILDPTPSDRGAERGGRILGAAIGLAILILSISAVGFALWLAISRANASQNIFY